MPAQIADVPLTDDRGRRTSLAELRGKTVVLADFLTLCQEVCPMTSQNMAALSRAVSTAGLSGRVQLVELTVDPERDTVARLHAYRQLFDPGPGLSLLTGDPASTRTIWRYFGVYQRRVPTETGGRDWWNHRPLRYDVDHSDVLIFLDPAGHERFVITGLPDTDEDRPPQTLRRFLDAEGRRNLQHPGGASWTVPDALQALRWVSTRK